MLDSDGVYCLPMRARARCCGTVFLRQLPRPRLQECESSSRSACTVVRIPPLSLCVSVSPSPLSFWTLFLSWCRLWLHLTSTLSLSLRLWSRQVQQNDMHAEHIFYDWSEEILESFGRYTGFVRSLLQ